MEQYLTSPIRCYFEVELPQHRKAQKRLPLLIALHGYQGDKDSMMRVARRIANGNMVVISLQGPNQFFSRYGTDGMIDPKTFKVGFGWGTTYKMEESVALHHRNLRLLIDLAVRKYRVARSRVFLLAFSQACAYNYRFVFSHPTSVRGCIGVCGGIPGDWHENPEYQTARTSVLHIAATDDNWYSREKNLDIRRKLAGRAGSFDLRFYKSPHRFPRSAIPHIRKWIEKHL